MRSSGDRTGSCEATHPAAVRAARALLAAIGMAASLAACATAPKPPPDPREPPPPDAAGSGSATVPEPPWLGAWPKAGCFHVAREPDNWHRFLLEDVEYRSARAPRTGWVHIFVHAVGIGDLEPRPIERPRDSRLEFSAKGDANGAFEILLLLVDNQGHRYEPRRLGAICPNRPKGQ